MEAGGMQCAPMLRAEVQIGGPKDDWRGIATILARGTASIFEKQLNLFSECLNRYRYMQVVSKAFTKGRELRI